MPNRTMQAKRMKFSSQIRNAYFGSYARFSDNRDVTITKTIIQPESVNTLKIKEPDFGKAKPREVSAPKEDLRDMIASCNVRVRKIATGKATTKGGRYWAQAFA